MNTIIAYILDDERHAIERFKLITENVRELEIIGSNTDPEQAIPDIIESKPDLLFLDIEMPNLSGFEVAEKIKKENLLTSIVFITAFDHYAIKAIKKDAHDYLLKPVDLDELKECIKRYKIKKHKTQQESIFTKRELQILQLLAKGHTSKMIAEDLCLSVHTVNTYRRNMLEKSGCRNLAEMLKDSKEKTIIS